MKMNEEKFVEIARKKAIIKQLQGENAEQEKEIRKTFNEDVKKFFLSKGYEFEEVSSSYRGEKNKFKDLRQLNENNTFKETFEPCYYIAGKNKLTIRFEWSLVKNFNRTQTYWYPEKQTLEDFYNRRLKKVLVLPIKVERNLKLKKIRGGL